MPAIGRAGAGLGRMRRDEGGVGQQRLPLPADVEEVVAVGAIAVQEDDEAAGGAGAGRQTGAVEHGVIERLRRRPPARGARRRGI